MAVNHHLDGTLARSRWCFSNPMGSGGDCVSGGDNPMSSGGDCVSGGGEFGEQ